MNVSEVHTITEHHTTIKEVDAPLFHSPSNASNASSEPAKDMEHTISCIVETAKKILCPHTAAFCWYIPLKNRFKLLYSASDSPNLLSSNYIPFGKGDILSETIKRKKPLLCQHVNLKSLPAFTTYYSKLSPIRSVITAPVLNNNSICAVFLADSLTTEYFRSEHVVFLSHFSNICSSIIDFYRIRSKDKNSFKFSQVSPEYFHNLYKHSGEFELCLDDFVHGLKNWLEFDSLTVAILNSQSKLIVHRSLYFDGSPFLKVGHDIDIEHSVVGQSFSSNSSGVIDKMSMYESQPRYYQGEDPNPNPNPSMLLISFSINRNPLGIVCVEHKQPFFFNNDIFFKTRFFVETLALTLQSIHQQAIIASARERDDLSPNMLKKGAFELALEREISRCVQGQGRTSLGIAIIGIDKLTEIGQFYGANKTKEAIRELARILKEKTRDYDYYGSLSEGVFAVTAYNTTPSNFNLWLEGVRAEIKKLLFQHGNVDEFNVTVSIGACVFSGNSNKSAQTVLSEAQSAFQVAVSNGGNSIKFF